MKSFLLASAIAVAIAGTTIAIAAPPAAPPPEPVFADRGPDGGMAPPPAPDDNLAGRRGRAPGPPPPSPAAHFRIERGTNVVDVKCADDQPMQACADIAKGFVDRLPKDPG